MTDPITLEALVELERLHQKATPGPWVATKMGSVWRGPLKEDKSHTTCGAGKQAMQLFEIESDNYHHIESEERAERAVRRDMKLIAATRNALPALLSAARELIELKPALAAALEEQQVWFQKAERLEEWQRTVRQGIRDGLTGFAALDAANEAEFRAVAIETLEERNVSLTGPDYDASDYTTDELRERLGLVAQAKEGA